MLVTSYKVADHDYIFFLQDVGMVGIDSEWKPYFGTRRNELALIQLASRERVYILDVCNLGSKCPELWQALGLILFANENIIKLGNLTFIFIRLNNNN
jgi:ribonuclease D